MKCNIGHTDRILRMTVGVTLIGLAVFGITGPWAWIGIIPLATQNVSNILKCKYTYGVFVNKAI